MRAAVSAAKRTRRTQLNCSGEDLSAHAPHVRTLPRPMATALSSHAAAAAVSRAAAPTRRTASITQHRGHPNAIVAAGIPALRLSRGRGSVRVHAASAPNDKPSQSSQFPTAKNATEAIEIGTKLFKDGKAAQAAQLLTQALGAPSDASFWCRSRAENRRLHYRGVLRRMSADVTPAISGDAAGRVDRDMHLSPPSLLAVLACRTALRRTDQYVRHGTAFRYSPTAPSTSPQA